MCLLVFAWKLIPGTPLIVAGNRDEFYDRPSTPAERWEDAPNIVAGRDLKAGGTWMGVAEEARNTPGVCKFAAITNIRAPSEYRNGAPSRGGLVADYLTSPLSAAEYVEKIRVDAAEYNGFNLILSDRDALIWFSNRNPDDPRNGKPLIPGIYGVSNASLDTPWPKVVRTKAEFASLICQWAPEEAYFEMLSNTIPAPDCRLPDTGVSFELERTLSSACICSPTYGTRSSSLIRIHEKRCMEFKEIVLK